MLNANLYMNVNLEALGLPAVAVLNNKTLYFDMRVSVPHILTRLLYDIAGRGGLGRMDAQKKRYVLSGCATTVKSSN